MIRVIVIQQDRGGAANVGGAVDTTFKTFELSPSADPEFVVSQVLALERYLREPITPGRADMGYVTREVVGVELA
jgi:hypothetical protein